MFPEAQGLKAWPPSRWHYGEMTGSGHHWGHQWVDPLMTSLLNRWIGGSLGGGASWEKVGHWEGDFEAYNCPRTLPLSFSAPLLPWGDQSYWSAMMFQFRSNGAGLPWSLEPKWIFLFLNYFSQIFVTARDDSLTNTGSWHLNKTGRTCLLYCQNTFVLNVWKKSPQHRHIQQLFVSRRWIHSALHLPNPCWNFVLL
jgi:hypothetical protein